MPVLHVNGEEYAVLVNDDRFVGNFAKDGPRAEGETFFFADFGVATLINASAVRLFGKQFVNGTAVDFCPCGENFYRVNVGVLVDDAAGDSVIFGVNQAESATLVFDVEPAAFAGGDGAVENVTKENAVDFDVFPFAPERPETPSDLGFGRIGGKAQKIAMVTIDFDNVSECGVADNFVDGSAKNPRMVAEGGFFTSGFKSYCFHGKKIRKFYYISFIVYIVIVET